MEEATNLQHWGNLLAGLAALIAALVGPIVTVILQSRQTSKASDQLKAHISTQVRKANGVPFAFIEHLPVPAWCKDTEGRMIWINFQYSQVWAIRPADYEGKFDYDVWPADVAAEFRRNDQRVINDRTTMVTVEVIPTRIGSMATTAPRKKWHIRKFPIVNVNDDIIGVGGLAWPVDKEVCDDCPLQVVDVTG